ncbi:MAG: DUF4869 domain-containing protein [Selenomonadaceae bacterium]|nr:DUF4869 domain-containing protein [Selenomonadaceae bacterium]
MLHIVFGRMQDVTINLRHIMDFGSAPFAIHIVNTDEIVHNMREMVLIAGRYV